GRDREPFAPCSSARRGRRRVLAQRRQGPRRRGRRRRGRRARACAAAARRRSAAAGGSRRRGRRRAGGGGRGGRWRGGGRARLRGGVHAPVPEGRTISVGSSSPCAGLAGGWGARPALENGRPEGIALSCSVPPGGEGDGTSETLLWLPEAGPCAPAAPAG